MKVINDNYLVCDDCTPVLANDDYSHLDYQYDEAQAETILDLIDYGMSSCGGFIALGDRDKDIDFSQARCDCCGTTLHGTRTHFVVLGD